MRRRAPRPLADALGSVVGESSPGTLLARVQACWPEVVGPAIAAEARPVAERDGTLSVACRSSTWASELELLSADLLQRHNEALGERGERPLTQLRAKVAELP